MVENLQAVVLLILDGVEAEVHFGEQQQVANELQLRNLLNQIQRNVKEPKSWHLLEAWEMNNAVFRQIKFAEGFQFFKAWNALDLVLTQVEIFEP